jgi:hypothetical protein
MLASSGCSEPISLSCPPGNGDVIVVDNPFEGRWSTDGASPRLTEEWRVSLPDGVRAPRPEAVGVAADGTVTIVELGTGRIIGLDPEGDETLSDEALPAEVAAALADAVLDERLPAPVVEILPPTGFLGALPARPIPGGADERRVSFVVRMAADAAVTDTLYAVSVTTLNDHGFVEWPRPGTGMPLVAVGPGGTVALAGASSAYRIDVLRADFADSLVVCRQAPALPLTESETGEIELPGSPPGLAQLRDASRRVKMLLPFGRIFLGSEGRLWVQRERPDPQRVYAHPGGAAYDVFAAGGAYLGEVRAPERVILVGEAAGLVYGLEASDEGRVSLVTFGLR